MPGKPFIPFAFLLSLTGASSTVFASEIFVCQDAEGRKVYQNTGSSRGCKRMGIDPLVTVPAGRATQPSLAAQSPVRPAVEQRSFPRVDRDTQRVRDNDRRRILEDELQAEEERLLKLRSEFNGGQPPKRADEAANLASYQERVRRLQDDVQRTENNVAAIRRELALTRD
jgi:hypothetical protein